MVAILLLHLPTFSQNVNMRLKIGDTVPDLVFRHIVNYNSSTAKLSDFEGKAIVLDFWNRSCGTCIAAFPKMQKLQEEFKDDLVILLVNDNVKETKELLNNFFENSTIFKTTRLPMILADSNFSCDGKLFPHRGVPYHVWIDKNRIVRATTWGEYATSENMKDLIAGKTSNIMIREDFVSDKKMEIERLKPALEMYDGLFRKYLIYYNHISLEFSHNQDSISSCYTLLIQNPVKHFGSIGLMSQDIRDKSGKQIGYRQTENMIRLYAFAYNADENSIIVDSDNNNSNPSDKNNKQISSYYDDSFVYEAVLPEGVKYDMYGLRDSNYRDRLKKDLDNYFGLTGTIELRSINCLVFYRTDKSLKLPFTKGGISIQENTMSDQGLLIKNEPAILRIMENIQGLNTNKTGFAVIDETAIDHKKNLDLTIHSNIQDILALSAELSKYGIAIKQEMRKLPVLVLKKHKNKI